MDYTARMTRRPRIPLIEAMGLRPLGVRYRQALVALRGEEDVPKSQMGLSSLKLLRPGMAWPLWHGRDTVPRQVILTNLFNHRQKPVEAGWSVKRTQVEDFRGRALTYDSHNGTDLCIPVGTTVHTAAAGAVVRVLSEFNRGGLKIFIDHGQGLMTCYAHLARALVVEGDVLERAAPIALSGYSGLDGFATYPFGVPHVHFNVWLNGEPVDPFARADEASLWRAGPRPAPFRGDAVDAAFEPSHYDEAAVDACIDGCKTPSVRARLRALTPLSRRAAYSIIERNYYPTRFPVRPNPYQEWHPRQGRLDLPFSADDFDGAVFVDER